MKNFLLKIKLKRPAILAAFAVLLLVIFTSLFGSVLAPHDPVETNLSLRLASPSGDYPLGNDALGRCLLSRILCGAHISVGIGLIVVILSALIGVAMGLTAGYFGRLVDEFLMRITDIFLSLPEMVAAMTLAGIMGPGLFNLIFALCATSWMRYARLVRNITLSVREQDYVTAARISGVSSIRIILRHILPANANAVIVLATIGLAKSIIAVSALGFLGFGVQPPDPEWGTLLMEGKDYILSAPHLSLYPGLVIMLTVLSVNLIGDWIRDGQGQEYTVSN